MAHVRFVESGRSYSPKISISTTGLIGLNNGARKRFGVDKYTNCFLSYDAETKNIGIWLTNDKEAEGSFRIRFRSTGADIAGKSFLAFFDIENEETLLYPAELDTANMMISVDMTKGKVRGRASKKQSLELTGICDE